MDNQSDRRSPLPGHIEPLRIKETPSISVTSVVILLVLITVIFIHI